MKKALVLMLAVLFVGMVGMAQTRFFETIIVEVSATFAGATIADLGTVATIDIDGGTFAGFTINGSWTAASQTCADLGSVTTCDINGGTWQGTIDGSWTATGQTCTDLGSVTTCDINGGAIDGTAIGATTASTGEFTSLETSERATFKEATSTDVTAIACYVTQTLSGEHGTAAPSYGLATYSKIIAADYTGTDVYVAGVVGNYGVTGTNDSVYPTGGVIGWIGDKTTTADGAFVALLDGDTGITTAGAAYAVRSLNSTSGSHFDYGLDLYSGVIGEYNAVTYDVADIRLESEQLIDGSTASFIGFETATFEHRYSYTSFGFDSTVQNPLEHGVEVYNGKRLNCVGINTGTPNIATTEGYTGVNDEADFLRFMIPIPCLWVDTGQAESLAISFDIEEHEEGSAACNVDVRIFVYGNVTPIVTDSLIIPNGTSRQWEDLEVLTTGFGAVDNLTADDSFLYIELTIPADEDDFYIYGVRLLYQTGIQATQ